MTPERCLLIIGWMLVFLLADAWWQRVTAAAVVIVAVVFTLADEWDEHHR